MDIKLPINLQNLSALNTLVDNPLALKPGQKIDVKVISTLLKAEINTIALRLAGDTITVQSNQPIKLAPGQDLQIQVTKIVPVVEFAIIDFSAASSSSPKHLAIAPDLRLKLVIPTTDKQATEPAKELPLPLKQPLAAKIIAVSGNKIQLQVWAETDDAPLQPQKAAETSTANKPTIIITIDRSQVQTPKTTAVSPSTSTNPAPSAAKTTPDFKVGQPVILEISSKGTIPEFKITLAAPSPGSTSTSTEEKVNGFLKQFLPKHESAPTLLNQLIKDLPQLVKNNSVPQVLQRIAEAILQNLPQRQQLNDSATLKQSIGNSGLFLEAKIPQLKENPEVKLDQDFKANLLKFIQALKKEVANPEQPESQDLDLASLKTLQQKTESNVAKIILDQLTSLPKEDAPKQIWAIDIPFVDRGQAETVSIEIERDKENHQESERGKWSVTITMEPPGLGNIQCSLSYYNETINTFFRSQQPQTTKLISHHLDYLKQQLEDAGLKTGIINIQDGLQPKKSVYPMVGNTLFDEKA